MPPSRDTAATSANVALLAIGCAVIATLAVSLAAAAQVTPAPATPRDVARGFIRPFEYVIPPGIEPTRVTAEPHILALAGADKGAGRAFGKLQLPARSARGVLVADVSDARPTPCPIVSGGPGRVAVGDDAVAFFGDMEDLAGLDVDDLSEATFDGRPAIAAASLSKARCRHVFVQLEGLVGYNNAILLTVPSHLIVSEVDDRLILIQAWAGTPGALEAWLPIADRFIDSIHFLEFEGEALASASPSILP